MWYQWPSVEAFDAWHAAACVALDIPYPGYNAATGEVEYTAQWTTAYTALTIVAPDDVRAVVHDDVAALVTPGTPCDPPPLQTEFPDLQPETD